MSTAPGRPGGSCHRAPFPGGLLGWLRTWRCPSVPVSAPVFPVWPACAAVLCLAQSVPCLLSSSLLLCLGASVPVLAWLGLAWRQLPTTESPRLALRACLPPRLPSPPPGVLRSPQLAEPYKVRRRPNLPFFFFLSLPHPHTHCYITTLTFSQFHSLNKHLIETLRVQT